jgi:hypothetical protein
MDGGALPGRADRLTPFSKSRFFDQTAAHNRGCEFASQSVVERSKLSDGHEIDGGEFERTGRDQFLEASNRHLVQASRHFSESRRTIGLKG